MTPPGGCVVCGGHPTATAKIRRLVGMLLAYRQGSESGPFCRDCGLATLRDATANTALLGWWSVFSFVLTLWAIPANLIGGRRYANLPAPGPPAAPNLRKDPGSPIWARPRFLIGMLVPVAVVFLIVYGILDQADRDGDGAIVTEGFIEVVDLRVGDCLDIPVTEGFDNVRAIPCDRPHDAEVVHNASLPSGAYPSDAQLNDEIDSRCLPAATTFLEVDPVTTAVVVPAVVVDALVPTSDAWDDGARYLTCLLVAADGSPLTQSMRGAGQG